MLYEVIVLGTFWFWILLVAELGWLLFCAAKEDAAWHSFISVFLFFGILQCFSDVNVGLFIWHNPGSIVVFLVSYLLFGCVWVFPKWWLFCKEHLRNYLDLREKFLVQKKCSSACIPEELKEEWRKYYTNDGYYGNNEVRFKPEPRNYKNRIITWMSLWPLSLLWTMLNDPIVRFFHHIYYEIAGVLRRISENVFKDVNKDFEKEVK